MTLDELQLIESALKNMRSDLVTPDLSYYKALEILNKEIALKTTDFVKKELPNRPDKPVNLQCPDCGGEMIPRQSVHGKFWGCKKYPQCKGTRDSMGRSKAERNGNKTDIAYEKTITSDDHEDIGPDGDTYRWRR